MKRYLSIVIALVPMLPALSAPNSGSFSLSSRFNIPEGTSAVVAMQGQSAIAIIGPIDSNVLATYRSMQAKSPATVLYIDSGGGDVSAAISLAFDLRKTGTRLVVAGKCFSACANYIFSGALHKDVLPGSLIGIHSSQLQYYTKTGVISVPQRNKQKIETLDTDGVLKKRILEKSKLENNFFSEIGLSKKYFTIFEDYQLRLEDSNNKNYSGCRTIDMWILSKNELQDMAVKGMNAIWMPTTTQEVAVISKNLGLNPANVFFGSEQQLSSACKKS